MGFASRHRHRRRRLCQGPDARCPQVTPTAPLSLARTGQSPESRPSGRLPRPAGKPGGASLWSPVPTRQIAAHSWPGFQHRQCHGQGRGGARSNGDALAPFAKAFVPRDDGVLAGVGFSAAGTGRPSKKMMTLRASAGGVALGPTERRLSALAMAGALAAVKWTTPTSRPVMASCAEAGAHAAAMTATTAPATSSAACPFSQ